MADKVNYRMTAAVWAHSRAKGGILLLLLAIAKHADDNGAAWPGNSTLAQHLRETKRAVIKQIQAAECMGELIVYRRRGRNNGYIVNVGITDDQRADALARLLQKFPDLAEVVNQCSPVPVNQRSPVKDKKSPARCDEVVNQRSLGSEPAFTGTGEPAFTRKIIRREQEEQRSPSADADAPAPTPGEMEDEARPLSAQQLMFDAICRAWGYTPSDVTDTLRGLIGKVGKELLKAHATPEDMPSLKGYLEHRARQDQWSTFTIAAMSKYWADFVAARANGYKPAKHPPYSYPELRFKARLQRRLLEEGKVDEARFLDYPTVLREMKKAGLTS